MICNENNRVPLLAVAILATGCGDGASASADAAPLADAARPDAAPPLPDAVDILFVIDNSSGMRDEQAKLAAAMPAFVSGLDAGGRPDLHIGVISTDMGAGSFIYGCDSSDDGRLQNAPTDPGCTPPTGRFIVDEADGAGGRVINYPEGELAQTLACISRLGDAGCGFEQPLAAMRRALDRRDHPAENDGFLREGALLAVIILSDEDDCSAIDDDLFDTSQQEIDSALGPLSSYRCFEFGVVCAPDSRTQVGTRASCRSRDRSPNMLAPAEYAEFLLTLQPASRIVAASIVGPPEPVSVSTDEMGLPQLDASCGHDSSSAWPGIRLDELIDAFPGRSATSSICDLSYEPALSRIAALITESVP